MRYFPYDCGAAIEALGASSRSRTAPPSAYVERQQAIAALHSELGRLTTVEAEIIRRRFGLDDESETLDQVAAALGIDKWQVRRIEAEAMRKLRHPAASGCLARACGGAVLT